MQMKASQQYSFGLRGFFTEILLDLKIRFRPIYHLCNLSSLNFGLYLKSYCMALIIIIILYGRPAWKCDSENDYCDLTTYPIL